MLRTTTKIVGLNYVNSYVIINELNIAIKTQSLSDYIKSRTQLLYKVGVFFGNKRKTLTGKSEKPHNHNT